MGGGGPDSATGNLWQLKRTNKHGFLFCFVRTNHKSLKKKINTELSVGTIWGIAFFFIFMTSHVDTECFDCWVCSIPRPSVSATGQSAINIAQSFFQLWKYTVACSVCLQLRPEACTYAHPWAMWDLLLNQNEQKSKRVLRMTEWRRQMTNTPGKFLLSKPYNHTSRKQSKIRALTGGSDVPNSG